MTTINEMLKTRQHWSADRTSRKLQLISWLPSAMDKSASPEEGFGWCGLHATDAGNVSASGAHRSKRRAYYMKECQPFAVVLTVWDHAKAIRFAKSRWDYYTEEEQKELSDALARGVIAEISPAKARLASPFAQWSIKVDLMDDDKKAEELRGWLNEPVTINAEL